jgi:hypothetical protein
MLNVEEAIDQYLSVLKQGLHKPVSLAGLIVPPNYVNAQRETVIALKARGEIPANFSMMDFIKWQDKRLRMKAAMQTKLVNNEMLCSADFAYVGDPTDISTWHLPIASKSFIKSSLELMAACTAIPKFERAEVREKVTALAKSFGISAGGPGSGRKK